MLPKGNLARPTDSLLTQNHPHGGDANDVDDGEDATKRELAETNWELVSMVLALSTFGWIVVVTAAVIIWVALAFWPARVADRKGHSFLGYFLLSLLFFPLSLIMAYAVEDRSVLV